MLLLLLYLYVYITRSAAILLRFSLSARFCGLSRLSIKMGRLPIYTHVICNDARIPARLRRLKWPIMHFRSLSRPCVYLIIWTRRPVSRKPESDRDRCVGWKLVGRVCSSLKIDLAIYTWSCHFSSRCYWWWWDFAISCRIALLFKKSYETRVYMNI